MGHMWDVGGKREHLITVSPTHYRAGYELILPSASVRRVVKKPGGDSAGGESAGHRIQAVVLPRFPCSTNYSLLCIS